jgi:hypothetical protein
LKKKNKLSNWLWTPIANFFSKQLDKFEVEGDTLCGGLFAKSPPHPQKTSKRERKSKIKS